MCGIASKQTTVALFISQHVTQCNSVADECGFNNVLDCSRGLWSRGIRYIRLWLVRKISFLLVLFLEEKYRISAPVSF